MSPRILAALPLVALAAAAPALAGPIAPPAGPVAPTHKTLSQVEPRIPIGPDTTPGDADSVFRITQPGSYYLTGAVTGESGKSGIEIQIADPNTIVTIDLGGFTVRGVPGSLHGINLLSGTYVLKDGVVQGWGGDGVRALTSASGSYQDILAVANAGTGFGIARGSTLHNCVARANGQGFRGAACAMSNCVAYGNSGVGFELFSGCSLTSCAAHQNAGAGYAAIASALVGCTADGNSGVGFDLQSCDATGCTAHSNLMGFAASSSVVRGCGVTSNTGSGIHCQSNCLIADNNIRFNGRSESILGDSGILVGGSNNRVEGNNVLETNVGADYGINVLGAGNIVVRNTCSNNSTNFSFVAGNTTGPVVTASGTISTTNPWANFEF